MQLNSTVYDCCVFTLPRISNRAGNITAIENFKNIPFEIKRVYYLYDIPGGESRGAHGHKSLQQFMIAAGGSFDVTLDDGVNKKIVRLDRPYLALHIKPGIWRDLSAFSSGATCLVLASEKYDANDYIRDYSEFLKFRQVL